MENDGEVICVGACAGRTLLNRKDLLCWRCGGDKLDRSKVAGATAEAKPITAPARLYVVRDGVGIICPDHWDSAWGQRPLLKDSHGVTYYCECKGGQKCGWWLWPNGLWALGRP